MEFQENIRAEKIGDFKKKGRVREREESMADDDRPDKASNTYRLITKTAKAVREKGKPFEILLKAKQDGNEMFDFLNVGHKYNQFYSYLLAADATTFERIVSDKPASIDNVDALAILSTTYNDDEDTEEKQSKSESNIAIKSTDLQSMQQNARLNKAKEFINNSACKKQYRIEDYPDNSLRKKIKQYLDKMVT